MTYSKRLTPRWTLTAAEALGETGRKGDVGEEAVANFLESKGFTVMWHQSTMSKQTAGIDIEFFKPGEHIWSCDVKHNITDDNTFGVYPNEWLLKSRSELILHVSVKTGMIASYNADRMREYYYDCVLHNSGPKLNSAGRKNENFWIDIDSAPDFVLKRNLETT